MKKTLIPRAFVLSFFISFFVFSPAQGTIVPSGFEETTYATLGFNPTSMAFTPDGRLFVADQNGSLRVVDASGTLLPAPFLSVSVINTDERGLLGVAVDPNITTNGFVYVYYTALSTGQNRVSRFTADSINPNIAESGSEIILLDNIAATACLASKTPIP